MKFLKNAFFLQKSFKKIYQKEDIILYLLVNHIDIIFLPTKKKMWEIWGIIGIIGV
jgi:hypothetical protein